RMHGAEDRVDSRGRARAGRIALQVEQRGIDGRNILTAFGEKELRVLKIVHGDCASRLPEHALHGLEDPARLERLDDEVFGTGLNRLDDKRLLPHGTAHEDSRLRIEFTD